MTYGLKKRMEISAAHKLTLDYDSPCQNMHGHGYIVTVYIKSKKLNSMGMILDFTHIKKAIHARLDHNNLNDVFDFNPTAENMAKWICDEINALDSGINCYQVDVQETEGNIATYWNDGEDE